MHMEKERLINPGTISTDERADFALRPKYLNDIIGQDLIRKWENCQQYGIPPKDSHLPAVTLCLDSEAL